MRKFALLLSVAFLTVGCAGGAAGPVFEYGPTDAPLRYSISGSTDSEIDTPMGPQSQGGTIDVTVTVDIGAPVEGGNSVTVVYETFESSGAGVGRLEAGDMIGKPFRGVLAPDGEMSFDEVPAVPSRLRQYFDPAAFLAQLLMPLPPTGAADLQSWPVHQEATENTEMTVFSTLDGTARVVGDTVWNGIPAKIVMVEGEFQMEGSGTPTGSPAEIDLVASGPSTSRFIWDAARGVMLASSTEGSGDGIVTLPSMDLSMPMTVTSKQTVELQR